MKGIIIKIYKIIKCFISRLNDDHVAAYAAQSAFYVIISAFPFLMLIFSLIKYTPVTEEFLMEVMESVAPKTIIPLASSLIEEIYELTSGAVVSVTAVFTVWSASKSVMAVIKGLKTVFKIEETRNYFHVRLVSSVYTLVFVVGIVISLVLMVFGNAILRMIGDHAPLIYDLFEWIMDMRILYVPLILTILFMGLYKLANNKTYSNASNFPGALFSALGWMIFSYFYSLYVDNFAGQSYMYGSLTTIVLMMLWIYFCMYILFVGAEISFYVRKLVPYLKSVRKNKKNLPKGE